MRDATDVSSVSAPISWPVFDALPAQSLMRLVCDKYAQMERHADRTEHGSLVLCDMIAAFVVLCPGAVTRSRRMHCAVQVGDGPGRGAVFFDWSRESSDGPLLVEAIDCKQLEQLVTSVWGGSMNN